MAAMPLQTGKGSGSTLLLHARKVGGADDPARGVRSDGKTINAMACRTRVRMGKSRSGRHTRATAGQGAQSPCLSVIRSGNTSTNVSAKSMAKRMASAACTSRTPEKTTFAFETPARRTHRLPAPEVTSNWPEDDPPSAMAAAPTVPAPFGAKGTGLAEARSNTTLFYAMAACLQGDKSTDVLQSWAEWINRRQKRQALG